MAIQLLMVTRNSRPELLDEDRIAFRIAAQGSC